MEEQRERERERERGRDGGGVKIRETSFGKERVFTLPSLQPGRGRARDSGGIAFHCPPDRPKVVNLSNGQSVTPEVRVVEN